MKRRTRKFEVSNVAPITAGSAPLHTSAETLKYLRQNKHNPLPYLKPDMLSRALEAFEHGRMREAVLLWEKMVERDDMILNVKPKREKDVSQLDMQVVVTPESGAEGEAHKTVLDQFWKSVRAVNAYDRNERGGFRRLVKQMMTSVSYKYAAHHIIWTPVNGELRATFEFVPLWLFENTTGKLRYLESPSATTGKDLDDSEWMVTCGDGLMVACSIGYLAKRSAFNDWLIFSEKFSVPGVLGRTSAKSGSAEALAMTEATQAFGHDWCAVITGDDGTHAEPIKIVQAQGNPSGMPMPAVIERVDRRMAALYRGADLSSMSSGAAGEGSGASLQEKETDILRRDDAETIAETLAEVSRLVIEWNFGNGVEPLARVELVVPVAEDSTSVVNAAIQLADRGAKVSTAALMDRLNLPKAADDDDALKPVERKTQEFKTQDPRQELANSEIAGSMQDLRTALAADMQPLGDALYSAYQAGDAGAMTAALRKISTNMPDLAGDASALSDALATQLTSALIGEPFEEIENAGNSNGSRKGWETRRANGWLPANRPKGSSHPKPRRERMTIEEVLDAAFEDTASRDFVDYSTITVSEAAGLKKDSPFDVTGWKRRVEADSVNKILSKHTADSFPVTEEDFRKLPDLHRKAITQVWEKHKSEWRLKTIARDGRDLWIIEQARTGQNTLNLVSMYRP